MVSRWYINCQVEGSLGHWGLFGWVSWTRAEHERGFEGWGSNASIYKADLIEAGAQRRQQGWAVSVGNTCVDTGVSAFQMKQEKDV